MGLRQDPEDCGNLFHRLSHCEWFCQERWLQVGRGLAQMAPCLRCCFQGRSHQQLGGVLLLPVPAQVESVPGLRHGSTAPTILSAGLPVSF